MFVSPAPPAAALRPSATQHVPGGRPACHQHGPFLMPPARLLAQLSSPRLHSSKEGCVCPLCPDMGQHLVPRMPDLPHPALAGPGRPLPQRVPSRLGGFLLVAAEAGDVFANLSFHLRPINRQLKSQGLIRSHHRYCQNPGHRAYSSLAPCTEGTGDPRG